MQNYSLYSHKSCTKLKSYCIFILTVYTTYITKEVINFLRVTYFASNWHIPEEKYQVRNANNHKHLLRDLQTVLFFYLQKLKLQV